MHSRKLGRSWMMLGLGFLAGLSLGAGMLIGVLLAVRSGASGSGSIFGPETVLNASATVSSDSMAMATGLIDEGVEGLFVLDFVTGNLQVFVMNPRTGQLGGMFAHNVAADLGTQKAPKYLMVTGQAMWRSYTGNVRPAQSIVYVADSNTGRYAAYMMPWNRQASSYNFAQVNPLIRIGVGTARTVPLE